MTWLLLYGGRVVARGSHRAALAAGARHQLLVRLFHDDGTELAPRLDRGVVIVSEQMLALGRRASA